MFLQECSHLAQSADCNTLWNIFCLALKQLVDRHVPRERLSAKKRSDKPWVTPEVKRLIIKRHLLLNAYRKQRNPVVFAVLKSYGKDINIKKQCC